MIKEFIALTSEKRQTDTDSEDQFLCGVDSIIQNLEIGNVQAAIDARSRLLDAFGPSDFNSVDGYEEAVASAYRMAVQEGRVAMARQVRRIFGQGIPLLGFTKVWTNDSDPADRGYLQALELINQS